MRGQVRHDEFNWFSPEDSALYDLASTYGFSYTQIDARKITILAQGKIERYEELGFGTLTLASGE